MLIHGTSARDSAEQSALEAPARVPKAPLRLRRLQSKLSTNRIGSKGSWEPLLAQVQRPVFVKLINTLPSVSLPRNKVEAVVDRFLSQGDCLSALVFLQDCPLGSLQDEDLLYSVFALATVSADQPTIRQAGEECRSSALSIVVKRISAGKVQAATLQALCVLTYADLVCG